jgi:hypothetical protein
VYKQHIARIELESLLNPTRKIVQWIWEAAKICEIGLNGGWLHALFEGPPQDGNQSSITGTIAKKRECELYHSLERGKGNNG